MDSDMMTQEMLEKIDELPESIYKLIEPKINLDGIKKYSILLTIILIISAICNYAERIIMALASNRYGFFIRKKITMLNLFRFRLV